MPLTNPRELRLLQSVQTALRAISIASGYGWDVKATSVVLDPENIFDVPVEALPFFIVEPTDDGQRLFQPAMQLEDEFVATITARVDAKGAGADRRTTIGAQLHADIEKALVADIERGGLAADTRLRKPQIYTTASGEQSVIVVQRVAMRVFREFGVPS